MREISMELKLRVIKLFLTGSTFDEIVKQLPISHGSAVKIIDDFRDGTLPVPPGMTEYIDELRRMVVDLKKHNTNIPQLQGYLRLHSKLREMGVDSDKISKWLDICQELACRSESSKIFVESALELKRLASQTGLTYESVVQNYNKELAELRNIERNIESKREQLRVLEHKYGEEQERAEKTLAAITAAIASARESLDRQKTGLQSELNEYLIRNKLSWRRIKLVEAVIDAELRGRGLTRKQQEKIRSEITDVGSISIEIDQLEQKRVTLKSEVEQLTNRVEASAREMNKLQQTVEDLLKSIDKAANRKKDVDYELALASTRLYDLNSQIAEKVENFYMTHLILDFLFNPESITNEDFEVLTNIMNIIQHNRLGMQPRQAVNRSLVVTYRGRLPRAYRNFDKHAVNIDLARKVLAYSLAPLVKDELVSKYDYDMLKAGCEVSRIGKVTRFRSLKKQNPVNSAPPVVILLR